jgi:hypothetical protein
MTELIVDQHNTDTLSTTDNNHQLFSESFLIKVSQCIEISNTIRADVRSEIVYVEHCSNSNDLFVPSMKSIH